MAVETFSAFKNGSFRGGVNLPNPDTSEKSAGLCLGKSQVTDGGSSKFLKVMVQLAVTNNLTTGMHGPLVQGYSSQLKTTPVRLHKATNISNSRDKADPKWAAPLDPSLGSGKARAD